MNKHFFTIAYMLALLLITVASASASMIAATWVPENTHHITITNGDTHQFEFYAFTTFSNLFVDVALFNDQGTRLHNYYLGYPPHNYITQTPTVTPEHYQEPGNYSIQLYSTDSQNAFWTAEITFTVEEFTPPPINNPPFMQAIPDHSHPENSYYEYQLQVSDPDGDELTCFDATVLDPDKYLPDWLTLDQCRIYGTTPSVSNDLDFFIMLGVTDGELNSIQNYTLTVLNTISAPVADFDWSPLDPLTNELVTFTSSSTDEQGIASYNWTFPSGTSTGPVVSWTFTQTGTIPVTLTVTNIHGLQDTITQNITVSNNVITQVVASANPTQGVIPLTVDYTCEATGGDAPLSYIWVFSEANFSGSHITRTFTHAGVYTSYCLVEDVNGDQATSIYVSVEATNPNNPPVADFVWSPQEPLVNQTVTFTSTSYDSDGHIVSWRWDFTNDGVYDAFGEEVSYTFSSADSYLVALAVSDNDGLKTTVRKTVVVSDIPPPINNPPVMQAIPDISVPENSSYEYQLQVSDPDGDILTCFAVLDLPAWLTLNPQTCLLSGTTPDLDQDHVFLIHVAVTDGQLSDDEYFYLTVTQTPNQAPVMQAIPDQSVPEDSYYEYQLDVSDPDEDTLICFSVELPSWLTLNEQTCMLTGTTPEVSQDTPFTVRVGVSDGQLTDQQSFIITVLDSPIIIDIDEFACNPDVVTGYHQYCSAHVSDQHGNDIQNATVAIHYLDGEPFASCITNFKGYCSVDPVVNNEAGFYTVQATATHPDYSSPQTVLQSTFRVWDQRYEIRGLDVYDDSSFTHPQDTFFRGDAMFTSFAIYDLIDEQYVCNGDLVNSVFLRVNNADLLNFSEYHELTLIHVDSPNLLSKLMSLFGLKSSHCEYRYHLDMIPLSDDYLGRGRVFAFTFNFNDDTAGQDSKVVHVLNNPVELHMPDNFIIEKHTAQDQGELVIDLAEYAYDRETPHNELVFSAWFENVVNDSIYLEWLNTHTIKLVSAPNHLTDETLHIAVDDTDGSTAQDTTLVHIRVAHQSQGPVAVAGDDQFVSLAEKVSFDASASYDPDGGNIVTYHWDFGNGLQVTKQTPQAVSAYYKLGRHTVTLTVTNDQGRTATDSLIVTVGEEIDSHPIIASSGLRVMSISSYTDSGYEKAKAGDVLVTKVVLENNAGIELKGLRITYSVPELGIKQKSSSFDLRRGQRYTATMNVYVPWDAQEYEYYSNIVVSNDDVRRSTYRVLEVVS